LYKRATLPQQRVLRIIEGAVKNVADSHGTEFDPKLARSIAKRATGTLTACWPEVLAAQSPSKKMLRGPLREPHASLDAAQILKQRPDPALATRRGQVTASDSLSPLRKLEKQIFQQMRDIKNSGNIAKADAWIEILRMISVIKKESKI